VKLADYVSAIRQRWVAILLATLLGGIAGFAIAKSTAPTYQSTSEVFVGVSSSSSVSDLAQGSAFTQNVVQSYAQIASSPIVLNPVIEELGLDSSAKDLARSLEVNTPLNTFTIQMIVTSSDRVLAAEIANAIADQLPLTIKDLMPLKDDSQAIKITQTSEALPANWPISPNTKFSTAIGLGIGLLLGLAYAVLRSVLNVRLTDSDDLAHVANLPVLGSIPSFRNKDENAEDPARTEAFRRLRANLDFVWSRNSYHRTTLITSALPQDGKTTTAINLAQAIAEHGDRVILIDADLRRPRLHKVSGLEQAIGLTTALIGRATVTEAIQKWPARGIDVMTSGEIPPNAVQLLDSAAMSDVLMQLKASYDHVIIDAPPLLSVIDAAVMSRIVDGTIFVASARRTKRSHVRDAVEALEVAGQKPLGAVLNRAPEVARAYGSYTSDPRTQKMSQAKNEDSN